LIIFRCGHGRLRWVSCSRASSFRGLMSRWAYRDLHAMASRVETGISYARTEIANQREYSTEFPVFPLVAWQDVIQTCPITRLEAGPISLPILGAWVVQWLAFACLAMLVSQWVGIPPGQTPSKWCSQCDLRSIRSLASRAWRISNWSEVSDFSRLSLCASNNQDPTRIDFDAKLDARETRTLGESAGRWRDALGDSIFGAAGAARSRIPFDYRVEAAWCDRAPRTARPSFSNTSRLGPMRCVDRASFVCTAAGKTDRGHAAGHGPRGDQIDLDRHTQQTGR
jgi:hypothetical protein